MSRPPGQTYTTLHVHFDPATSTLKPTVLGADAFFGLEVGTNGTAATMRRAVIEAHYRGLHNFSGPIEWVRSNGKPATGITLIPSNKSESRFSNPWSGK